MILDPSLLRLAIIHTSLTLLENINYYYKIATTARRLEE